MAVTTTPRAQITRWSDPADPFTRAQMDASHASIEALMAIDVQDLLANRPAPGTRGRFFSETATSTGLPGTTWRDDGAAWRSVGSRIVAVSANDTAQIVRGAASQQSDLTSWQNSAGSGLAHMSSAGELFAQAVYASSGYIGARLSAAALASTDVVAVLRGAASQTGHLQEWQNSAGTVLSAAAFDGRLYVPYLNAGTGVDTLLGSGATVEIQGRSGTTKALLLKSSGGDNALEIWSSTNGVLGGFDAGGRFWAGAGNPGHPVLWDLNAGGAFTAPDTTAGAAALGTMLYGSMAGFHYKALNSAGSTIAAIDSSGTMIGSWASFGSGAGIAASNSGGFASSVTVSPNGNAGRTGIIVKGLASQTGALQEWQDSTGVAQAWVTNTGAFATGRSLAAGSGASGASSFHALWGLTGGSTTQTTLSVRGIASQTGNLQEWQNSAGVILCQVDSNGNLYLPVGSSNVKVGNLTLAYSSGNGTYWSSAVAGDGNLLLTGSLRVGDGTNYKPVLASAFTVSSARETKTGIRELTEPWDVVRRLRPVRYEYRGAVGTPRAGFIADEVAGVFPEAVSYGGDDKPEGIHYGEFVPLLVSALHTFDDRLAKVERALAAA